MTELPHGLEIEAPVLASDLSVNAAFLEARLGAWGADRAFAPGNATADFSGKKAEFRPFDISEDALFTWGDENQIRFLQRPMWINASQGAWGEAIELHMDDGDPRGQQIYVSKEWLWGRGIHRPNATHEDGAVLPVEKTADGRGFLIDVHHFSHVVLNPAGLTVLSRDGSTVTAHNGVVAWYPHESRLEISVPLALRAMDILIEKDWMDVHLPNPQNPTFWFGHEVYGGDDYYRFPVMSHQTPATIVLTPYIPGPNFVWTYGDPKTIQAHAFNDTVRLSMGAIKLMMLVGVENLTLELEVGAGRPVYFNMSFLESHGITLPHAEAEGGEVFGYETFDGRGFVLERASLATIKGDSPYPAKESRVQIAILGFEASSQNFHVMRPAFLPYLTHGLDISLYDIPFGQTMGDPQFTLERIELEYGGLVVYARNATHDHTGAPVRSDYSTVFLHEGGDKILVVDMYDPEDVLQLTLEVDIATLEPTDVLNNGLFAQQSCKTMIQRGYQTGSYPASHGGNEISQNHRSLGGLTTHFTFNYRNECNQPVEWFSASYDWGYGARGKSHIVGYGLWASHLGTPIRGSHLTSNWKGFELKTINPSGVMLGARIISSPGGFATFHSSVGNMAERRNIECSQTDGEVLIWRAIDFVLGLSKWTGWANLLTPDQHCWATLTTHSRTFNQDSSWAGKGGKVTQSTNDGTETLGFVSVWYMEGNVGNHFLKSRMGGDFTIYERFTTCVNNIAPCDHYYNTNTRYNWSREHHLRLEITSP